MAVTKPVASTGYIYTDEAGEPLFQVLRGPDKTFTQWSLDGHGGWRAGRNGAPYVLYRLPQVIAAVERGGGEPFYVVEGEKDVDRAWSVGSPATTNPGGAGKWRDEYSRLLACLCTVVVFDRDPPDASTHSKLQPASIKLVGQSALRTPR